MSAAERVNANRPTAERILEDDEHLVTLDLTPVQRDQLRDVCRLVGKASMFALVMEVGHARPGNVEAEEALTRLVEATAPAYVIILGPDQADDLATDLWSASACPCGCDHVGVGS